MNPNIIARLWMAGAVSFAGSFSFSRNGKKWAAKFKIKSRVNREAVEKFAMLAGVSIYKTKRGDFEVSISGKPLDDMMAKLWPYITEDKKQQYSYIVQRAAKRNAIEEEHRNQS